MKLFLIHNGRQNYLKYTLKQLLKYHKPQNIIFLSDDKVATKNYLKEDIIYENISEYFKDAREFETIYQHMSYNKKAYELFCFQRWLILNEYVKKHNIPLFSHIDSDVLLFCNTEMHYDQYLKKSDFCYVWSCGHIFFWTQKGLQHFSDFLFDQYTNHVDHLEPYFTGEKISCVYRNNGSYYQDRTNCVTDMTLFDLFLKQKNIKIQTKDIGIIQHNNVFDNCIHMDEGFRYSFWFKKLKWENNQPYWTLKGDKTQKRIYFKALHFQWESKKFMKYFSEGNTSSLKFFKESFRFGIKKTGIIFLETVFKQLWIYEIIRNLYLKHIRKWVNPRW